MQEAAIDFVNDMVSIFLFVDGYFWFVILNIVNQIALNTIDNLKKVKTLKSNEPVLTPASDFVIQKNTKAILVRG